MTRKIEYKAGQVFSDWTLLEEAAPNKAKQQRWLCECKCGTVKTIQIYDLKGLKSTQCSNCRSKENRINPLDNAWNRAMYIYIRNAKIRGYEWGLSMAYFKEVSLQNCYYCNAKPRQNNIGSSNYIYSRKVRNLSIDHAFAESRIIYNNGLDRIDNTKGYTEENVVACCTNCNMAKKELSSAEFRQLITQIYNNWAKHD